MRIRKSPESSAIPGFSIHFGVVTPG